MTATAVNRSGSFMAPIAMAIPPNDMIFEVGPARASG
jgi:hypothetical protein